MTSRNARDEALTCAVSSRAVPESIDLPPPLDVAIQALIQEDDGPIGSSFAVAPEPESVTAARHFTTTRLAEWNMAQMRDDVGLVVSELVTNALRHSLPSCHEAPAEPIVLRLVPYRPWLLCGIFDGGSEAPRRKEPDYIAETGRGLHLVDSFTYMWGWRGLARGGKVVWALFRLSDPLPH